MSQIVEEDISDAELDEAIAVGKDGKKLAETRDDMGMILRKFFGKPDADAN